jgi:ornithine cyclodeaminase
MERSHKLLYLSQEDVVAAGVFDMQARIADIEQLMVLWDKAQYAEPVPPIISWEQGIEDLFFVAHPAWVGGEVNATGNKWIASSPENRVKRNMPRSSALIILNDMETGYPKVIMEGALVTAMRTGAVAAVAAKHVAAPDAEVVGLIGTGFQSRAQALGLKAVLPGIRLFKIFNASPARASTWAEEMQPMLNVPIEIQNNSRAVVEGSDVVVAATAGGRSGPAEVEPGWFKAGSFYSAISPRDLNRDVIKSFDRVVLTKREELHGGRKNPLADLYREGILNDDNVIELAEIVTGKKPGRQTSQQRIFMRPTGMSVADVITAETIYRTARARGIGQELPLWREPKWV